MAVEVADADLGDGAIERDVGDSKSRSGSEGCQLVGHGVVVARDKGDLHLHLGVEIVGEERTKSPVDKTGYKNLVLRGACFAFEEAAGETSESRILLLVVDGEGHEVDVLANLAF